MQRFLTWGSDPGGVTGRIRTSDIYILLTVSVSVSAVWVSSRSIRTRFRLCDDLNLIIILPEASRGFMLVSVEPLDELTRCSDCLQRQKNILWWLGSEPNWVFNVLKPDETGAARHRCLSMKPRDISDPTFSIFVVTEPDLSPNRDVLSQLDRSWTQSVNREKHRTEHQEMLEQLSLCHLVTTTMTMIELVQTESEAVRLCGGSGPSRRSSSWRTREQNRSAINAQNQSVYCRAKESFVRTKRQFWTSYRTNSWLTAW